MRHPGVVLSLAAVGLLAGAQPHMARAEEASSTTSVAEKLFERRAMSVVAVHRFNNRQRLVGMGSGFFVAGNRVLTNHHVIKDAHAAQIVLHDQTTAVVTRVLNASSQTDLALLEVEYNGSDTLKLAATELPAVGTRVYAIGNPKGLENTLSEGLISGHRVDPNLGIRVLQTSAAVSHGSSGGPLLTGDGTVVGVVFAGLNEGQNLNFAIPASTAQTFLDQPHRAVALERPGPPPSLYSAIAHSASTGKFGWAWDALSRSDAERAARDQVNASDSKVIIWTRDAWCALAFGEDSTAWGVAWASTQAEAEAKALRECQRRTRNCYIKASFATDGTGAS